MAKRKKPLPSATVDSKGAPGTLEEGKPKLKNWADKPESDAYIAALKIYPLIANAYRNQEDRSDNIEEYSNIVNAIPDENQQYNGNSTCYVPAVRDALKARAKRIIKQCFPASHRHVDAITADSETPYTQLSMIEHYIRKTELKDECRTILMAGDTTGQWNVYLDWSKSYRNIREVVKRAPILQQVEGEDVSDLDMEDPLADEEEELEEKDVVEEGPEIVPFADEDLAVIPPTCKNIQKAKIACMRLRMSEEKVQELADEGVFILPEGTADAETYFKKLEGMAKGKQKRDPTKQASVDAGVKTEGTNKFALIYEAYTRLDLGGATKEEAIVYFAGESEILGIIKLPYWSGKRPIISEPVDKLIGSFKGRSIIEPVKYLQWNLNDFWNLGQDSGMYSQMPVFAADPLKNPNWQTMVLGLAAVWPISPSDVKALNFPQLYKDSMAICDAIKRQIWESLEVNETMMGKMPQGRKNNQLMGAMQQEQQINISDVAERFESVVLNKIVEWFHELDAQFRTDTVTVQARGEIGVKANMIEIEPQQWNERYFFQWYGTKAMIGQQLMQQQIAMMNVLKGIPPAMTPGRKLNLVPMLDKAVENLFGPEIAPKIFIDTTNMFTVDPDTENEMLHNGLEVQVHEADDDAQHLQAHMKGAGLAGDPFMFYKKHMTAHMMQLQKKRQMEMSQQAPQQGSPGGPGGTGPGVGGTPPAGARGPQQPPGAVHPDQMSDGAMPGRG